MDHKGGDSGMKESDKDNNHVGEGNGGDSKRLSKERREKIREKKEIRAT